MAEFFNRDFSVTIGNRVIRARNPDEDLTRPTLRVVFDVQKSDKREPNKASVSIYNLSDDSRSAIQEAGASCLIEAGYVGSIQTIFRGDLSVVTNVRNGPDWITTFQSGDGQKAYRSSRVSETFPPGTGIQQAMTRIAECMDVDIGNATERLGLGIFRKGISEFTKGLVVNGRCSDEFEKLAKTAGLTWSVQDGELQVLGPDETTTEEIVSLAPNSGLIGSPDLGEKGIVKARSLLIGDIRPGRRVQIISKEFQGIFKTLTVTHSGDTWGQSWYTDFEAKPV